MAAALAPPKTNGEDFFKFFLNFFYEDEDNPNLLLHLPCQMLIINLPSIKPCPQILRNPPSIKTFPPNIKESSHNKKLSTKY